MSLLSYWRPSILLYLFLPVFLSVCLVYRLSVCLSFCHIFLTICPSALQWESVLSEYTYMPLCPSVEKWCYALHSFPILLPFYPFCRPSLYPFYPLPHFILYILNMYIHLQFCGQLGQLGQLSHCPFPLGNNSISISHSFKGQQAV